MAKGVRMPGRRPYNFVGPPRPAPCTREGTLMKKHTLTIAALLMLAGCGTINNKVVSDETLQDKAAFALNTTADEVTISDRKAGMQEIRFVATVGKKSYQCYVSTVMGLHTSDALCSGSNSVKKSGGKASRKEEAAQEGRSCNALLKAAGRC